MSASTTAALSERSAERPSPSSPPVAASAGIRISSGTTARSWNSSTPITSRPCAFELEALGQHLDTIAVELIASAPPSTMPGLPAVAQERARRSSPATVVIATCASPRPNTARRIARSCGRLNSSPIENIRNTTPNSARSRRRVVVGHERERVRADRDADDEVAEDRRQPRERGRSTTTIDRAASSSRISSSVMRHRIAVASSRRVRR